MRRDPVREVDADGGELVVPDPDRRPASGHVAPRRRDAEVGRGEDQDLFQVPDEPSDVSLGPFEAQDRVGDELARPVERQLPAAVGAVERDAEPGELLGGEVQVVGPGVPPRGDHVLVLEEEEGLPPAVLRARFRLLLEDDDLVVGAGAERKEGDDVERARHQRRM